MAEADGERGEQDEKDEGNARSGEEEQGGEERGAEERGAEEELEPRELSQDELVGMDVVDSHGAKIGKIEALFIHQQEERASWARVKTGIGPLGSHAFVPLHDAQDEDGQLRVVYEKEHVGEAPEIEPEGNEISDEEADQLHSHYGLGRVQGLATETKDEDIELSREARDAEPPTMKDRPWAVEKYPLPDMDRDNVRDESEEGGDGGEDAERGGDEGEEREQGEDRS